MSFKKELRIKIVADECAENPVKDWDMLGTFVCMDLNYNWGDEELSRHNF